MITTEYETLRIETPSGVEWKIYEDEGHGAAYLGMVVRVKDDNRFCAYDANGKFILRYCNYEDAHAAARRGKL